MEAHTGTKGKSHIGAGWKKRMRLTNSFTLICATSKELFFNHYFPLT